MAATTAFTQYNRGQMHGIGVATVPTAVTVSAANLMISSAGEVRLSDTLAAVPLKRDNGEPWEFYILVSSLGHQSIVQSRPGTEILYAGASA